MWILTLISSCLSRRERLVYVGISVENIIPVSIGYPVIVKLYIRTQV